MLRAAPAVNYRPARTVGAIATMLEIFFAQCHFTGLIRLD